MFEGTVRDNLDPRHAHGDTELWSVLGMFLLDNSSEIYWLTCITEHARLKDYVSSMDGQLDAQIQEGGMFSFLFFFFFSLSVLPFEPMEI